MILGMVSYSVAPHVLYIIYLCEKNMLRHLTIVGWHALVMKPEDFFGLDLEDFFCSGQSKPCVNFHFRPHNFPTNPRFFSSLNHQSSSVFIPPFHRLITTFPAKVAILWYQHLTQTHIMLVICFVYPQYISLCHIETAVNYHFSPANPTV